MRRLALILVCVAAACGKGEVPTGPGAGIVDAWKKAGLNAQDFQVVDGKSLGGGSCRAGYVSGVEATLCEFADADRAKRAEVAGLAQVGEATGAALSKGNTLLVIADRLKVDPTGKHIKDVAAVLRGR